MLTKSATLMPAADLPPSEARGHYHAGLLTKSATLMPAADLPPSEARGRYRGLLTKSKRAGTRQKRKSKTWRVRSTPPTGHRHTPEKKKQDLACAEPSQQGTGTRQKRKSKTCRVRSHHRRLPPNYKMKFSVNQLT